MKVDFEIEVLLWRDF